MAAGACYLSVAYPEEKFDSNGDGQPDKAYESMMNPTCGVFM
jgi:hypothetical protein